MSVWLRPAGRHTVPQPWVGSRETSDPKVAAGPHGDTSPRVGSTQLTTTFFRRQQTVSGQVRRSHAL